MATITSDVPVTQQIGRISFEHGSGWIRLVVPRAPDFRRILLAVLFIGTVCLLNFLLWPPHAENWFVVAIVVALFSSLPLLQAVWISARRDIITIFPPQLVVRREIFRLGWTSHYPLAQLSNLQFRHQVNSGRWSEPRCLSFDYQYQPRFCARDIAVAEAADLIPLIQSQFPDLVARSSSSSDITFDDPVQVGRK